MAAARIATTSGPANHSIRFSSSEWFSALYRIPTAYPQSARRVPAEFHVAMTHSP